MRWVILFFMMVSSSFACPIITIDVTQGFSDLELSLSIDPLPATYQVMIEMKTNETIIDRTMITNLSMAIPRPEPGLYEIEATLIFPCYNKDKKDVKVRQLKTLTYNGSQKRLFKAGTWLALICSCTLAIALVIRR